MSRFSGPQGIVTNGLVLNLDAGDPDSYTRSQPPYVEVLVVAGGGSGGSSAPANGGGGGGGAGGVIYNSAYQLTSAAAVTVTVGAGGAGQTTNNVQGNDGSNSVFGALTAIGGGGGGGAGVNTTGRNGGSGGGAGYAGYYNNFNSGTGTAGQGFRGGFVLANNNGAAGGGAGGVGENTFDSRPEPGYPNGGGGNGGPGVYYSISGTSTLYSTGGNGSLNGSNTIVSGSGTFGAYGGSSFSNTAASGIVIVRYPGLPAATGGTITYLNGYTIHTFTSSGTFTPYPWNDISGNNNSGSLINGVGFNSYQNGGYLSFDGVDDRVATSFKPSGYRSYFVWIKYNITSSLPAGYSLTGTQEVNAYNYVGIENGGKFYYYFGTNGESLSNIVLNPNTWYYQGLTLSSDGYARAYLNGVLVSTLSSGVGTTATNEFSVGCINQNHWVNGSIASVVQYNRALSQAEITQNFNAQYSRFGVGLPSNGLIVNLDASNPQSYPGTGTTWYDLSGTGNNATLANGVAFSSANGGIFDFDGVDDYAYINDNATLDLAGDKSQGIWLYMDSGDLGKGILGKADSSVNGMALSYGWSGYGFQNIAWNSVNEPSLSIGGADVNNWYYVAGVQNGGTRYIYVIGANGFRISSYSGGNHTWNNALNFTIGQVAGYYTNMKAGAVHVYNRALSASEISAIYATQKSRFGLS